MIEPPLNAIPPTPPRREASRISALFHGHIVASSTDVIDIATLGAPPQRYFPKADVGMSSLRAVDTVGEGRGAVTRYTLYRDGEVVENAAWSYDRPGNPLAGRIAFRDGLVRYDVTPLAPRERPDAEEPRAWSTRRQPSQSEPDENRDPAAPAQPYRDTGSI